MKLTGVLAASIAIAAIAFFTLVWLVWLNRGGERFPMLFWKAVLGPLVLAVLIVGYDLNKPVDETKATVSLTFWRLGSNLIANEQLSVDETLPALPTGYTWLETAYGTWLKTHSQQTFGQDDLGQLHDFYTEVAEAGFITWLATRNPEHWQVDEYPLAGFLGSVGRIGSRSRDAERNPTLLSTAEIAKATNNDILRQENLGKVWKMGMPSNAKVRGIPNERGGRGLSIETPFITFNMGFWCMSLPVEIKGDSKNPLIRRVAAAFHSTDVSGTYVYVDFRITPKYWRRWSGRTEQELQWAESTVAHFRSDFEWVAEKK